VPGRFLVPSAKTKRHLVDHDIANKLSLWITVCQCYGCLLFDKGLCVVKLHLLGENWFFYRGYK